MVCFLGLEEAKEELRLARAAASDTGVRAYSHKRERERERERGGSKKELEICPSDRFRLHRDFVDLRSERAELIGLSNGPQSSAPNSTRSETPLLPIADTPLHFFLLLYIALTFPKSNVSFTFGQILFSSGKS